MRSEAAAPPAKDLADAEVVTRIAAGELALLGVLFDRHGETTLRFIRRLVGPDEAPDLVQETFLRINKIAEKYDGRSLSARSWILGIAYSIVREHRRSFSRFRRALSNFGSALDVGDRGRDPGPASDVERALGRLSTERRELVLMADLFGFSTKELASALDIPEGTVGSRLFHARAELRSHLGGDHGV